MPGGKYNIEAVNYFKCKHLPLGFKSWNV